MIAALHADGPAPSCGYWLTRNRLEGELSSRIDVWVELPDREEEDDDNVFWFVHGEDAQRAHYARWTIDRARREVGNGIPDTDRECVAIGMVQL